MKTILVATDFSNASGNATRYGVKMAHDFNGRVILFHAYQQIPVTVVDTLVLVKPPDVRKAVQEQLETEADRLTGEQVRPIELLAREGLAIEAILEAGRKMNVDLIIAGMKGSGKAFRRLLGSTVTSLASKTTIPLLIIPEGVSYTKPRAIALANDITPDSDIHLLDPLRSIAEKSGAKFYIVRIIQRKSEEVVEVLNMSSVLDSMVKTLEPVYEYPLDREIAHALGRFISSHLIDMLVMIPHRHSLLEKLIHPSVTKEVILKAKVPLLILPDIKRKP